MIFNFATPCLNYFTSPSVTPVSYTHLDVYKRQEQLLELGVTLNIMPCRRPPIVIHFFEVFVDLSSYDRPSGLSVPTQDLIYSGKKFHRVSFIRPKIHRFPIVGVLELRHYCYSVPDVFNFFPHSLDFSALYVFDPLRIIVDSRLYCGHGRLDTYAALFRFLLHDRDLDLIGFLQVVHSNINILFGLLQFVTGVLPILIYLGYFVFN